MAPSGHTPTQMIRSSATANETLKRGWPSRVAWSIVVSVGVHAAGFVAFPRWQVQRPARDPRDPEPTLAITTINVGGGGPRGAANPSPEPNAEPAVTGDGGLPAPDAITQASLSALWDRLAGDAGLTPTVVSPEVDDLLAEELEAPADPDDALEMDVDVGDLAPLTGAGDSTDLLLDRLSGLRPEIVLTEQSLWILLLNPRQVGAFMREKYARGDLVPNEPGWVGVVLWIDAQGAVGWADIDQSSGRPEMDEVALELFREVARFRPARDTRGPASRSAVLWLGFPWCCRSDPPVPDVPR